MNVVEHYTYRVRWSSEDGEYVGTVAELPSLSWQGVRSIPDSSSNHWMPLCIIE